jgi:hypothetical protein
VPDDNPEKTNRRGCYVILAVLALVIAVIVWLATLPGDSQQSNEALGEVSI